MEVIMTVLTYSGVRANLAKIMENVCKTHKEVLITTKGNKNNVVMISQEDFEGIKETFYLLSNPNNAKRLLESIKELEDGKAKSHELIEA